MQYSPKLKKAMEQIKTILQENDIAGIVVIHTPGFSEYIHHLETSYSGATVMEKGVHIKFSEREMGRDKAQRLAEGTFNMMTHFADFLALCAPGYLSAQMHMESTLKGKQSPGHHSSHSQQNN